MLLVIVILLDLNIILLGEVVVEIYNYIIILIIKKKIDSWLKFWVNNELIWMISLLKVYYGKSFWF